LNEEEQEKSGPSPIPTSDQAPKVLEEEDLSFPQESWKIFKMSLFPTINMLFNPMY
jgi:hypothetical protein